MSSAQPRKPFDLILSGRIHIAGGLPSTVPDVILCVIFLLFFIPGAALNVRLFIKYGKRLRWQMALFGFCMARITTMVMRIVWSQRQSEGNVAIAAIVFLNAGVIIIFLINMMMSKKALFRTHYDYFQAHPGKKALVKKVFAAMGFLLLAFLIILIVGAVQGFLTLDPQLQRTDTILKRMGSVVFLVYCVLPFFILGFNAIWRLKTGPPASSRTEKYDHVQSIGIGAKSWDDNSTVWKNSAILLVSASLVTFEYGIKVTQGFADASVYRWYFSKGAFYGAALLPETMALYILIASNMAVRYAGLAVIPKGGQLEKGEEATLVNGSEGDGGAVPKKNPTM